MTMSRGLQLVRCGAGLYRKKRPSLTRSLSSQSNDSNSVLAAGGDIFNVYHDSTTGNIKVSDLLADMELTGIRRTDPRLKSFISSMDKLENEDNKADMFRKIINENHTLLSQILGNEMVIPDFSSFSNNIRDIFMKCQQNNGGQVATYIPQLARYSPSQWAASVCTVDGQRLSLGDVENSFTLQSCSKPFTYAICLNELGPDDVHTYISHEPSGRSFNEICLDRHNKPHNPLLNSGAILSCGLLLRAIHPDQSIADKYDFLIEYLQRIAGESRLTFNNAVFLSEQLTADRNYAMAYLMREYKCFPEGMDLTDCLDLYFQSCSIEVTAESLSVMGATLANGGICPTTGDKVLSGTAVRNVLSLMYSCGMYNHSGEFSFNVGLPAKSGVSGGLVLVVPNVMSIALWSPALDTLGNSVRGIQFCNELVSHYNFHRFDNLRHSEKKLDPRRSTYTAVGSPIITLLFAAKAGDVTALRRQMVAGVDMSMPDYDGRTALHVAAAEGQVECVEFLLGTYKVPPEPVDRWGNTPIMEAQRFEHQRVQQAINKYL